GVPIFSFFQLKGGMLEDYAASGQEIFLPSWLLTLLRLPTQAGWGDHNLLFIKLDHGCNDTFSEATGTQRAGSFSEPIP
ncbi:MAG TPA: hypothetical protein VJ969_11190, partial [Desulfopila sp.]|nr:hypothetical protein [Desulfopila sp.]